MKDEKILDLIRNGEIDLEFGENGHTVLSDQPLFELRQYISALEAGYQGQQMRLRIRSKIDEASTRLFIEREFGMSYDRIQEAVDRYTAKSVECVVFGADSTRYGKCPTCHTMLIEGKDESCHNCGQALKWDPE